MGLSLSFNLSTPQCPQCYNTGSTSKAHRIYQATPCHMFHVAHVTHEATHTSYSYYYHRYLDVSFSPFWSFPYQLRIHLSGEYEWWQELQQPHSHTHPLGPSNLASRSARAALCWLSQEALPGTLALPRPLFMEPLSQRRGRRDKPGVSTQIRQGHQAAERTDVFQAVEDDQLKFPI